MSATASSGLPVTFSVVQNGNCSVSGNVVTFLNVGNCGVLANQAGNSSYAAAAQVGQIVQVTNAKIAQTITFAAIPQQYVGVPLTVSATASSGLAVTFTVVQNGNCSISGNVVTFINPGACGVIASQAGNATYSAAPNVGQVVQVAASPGSFKLSLASPTLTLAPGSGTTDQINVVSANGFNGNVSLSAGALPTGVSDAFSPYTVTSSNTQFVLYVQPTATPGTYSITINGVSGSLTASTTLTLIIPKPDFSIALGTTSYTLTKSLAGVYPTQTDTVTTAALNGFTGTETLSISGLPAHLAAAFSPTSISTSGSSKLTLTPAAGLASGTYTLTVTGTSGSLVHTAMVTVVCK